jgi:transglutaminase-like putative cysteine protease/tetratricopeptide (TPR) repeat protein
MAALAQTPAVEPWKAPHFSLDPSALLTAAAAINAPDTANVAVLEDDESYSFDEAGRSVHTQYVVYKVLNQKGVESWDSIALEWQPWHEQRPSIKVRVISPDRTVHWLDPKSITEGPAREGEYKTYSDDKVLRAPFPAIEAGVVVEEEFVNTETQPFFAPGHVARILFGREGIPVAHSLAVLSAPLSLPLHTHLVNLTSLQPRREEANGRVTITYEQGFLEAFERGEPNLPPDLSRFPLIEFSTGVSWQQMAAEYSKIVDAHAKVDAVNELVDRLIAGKSTAAEKEAALTDWLNHEIRYTGLEMDASALIPHDPGEVMAQKYGDCKDKATLLVTMLRAAGIPANVALLSVGSRLDVPEDLPGMGLFDHAIVYVPGDPAHNVAPLWIDATDQYARLGQLPAGDQGRLALVADPATTKLILTPQSNSRQNVLFERREIRLSENGPASITEVTRPMGVFEDEYRDYYADKPDKDTREALSNYVKSQYLSDKLGTVERSDPGDLSKQFELTLSCEKAKRGYTDLDAATGAIRLESLFERLPGELKQKDDPDKKEDKDHPKKPRTADWTLFAPFSAEWEVRIVPPAGFIPKPLPKDVKMQLGPALLTEEFSTEKDHTVVAHLLFDSVKRRYSVAEADAMRNQIADLLKGPAILINFEPEGEALLRDGKVKEALASYRTLIAQHPAQALYHLQMAKVLLEAGLGEAARKEAHLAVQLDPNSALAEKTLAQILKYDVVGRPLRPGSDFAGAIAAYRASIKLDGDEHTTEADLAILLEHDAVGRRYSQSAPMKEALATYRKIGQDKLEEMGLINNIAYASFYAGDAAGAIQAATALGQPPVALIAASEAILHGSKAGLAEANKRSNSDSSFKEAAHTAGEMLMNMRKYDLAADFLEAGAAGDEAAHSMGLAAMLRHATPHENVKFEDTPTDLVRRIFLLGVDPQLSKEKLLQTASHNARLVIERMDAEDLKKILEEGKKLDSQLARQGSSMDVTTDVLFGALDPKSEGNDQTGYREKMQIPGGSNMTFFVVKEEGHYKLLDSLEKPDAVALEIVDRIGRGDLAGAKALLDWLREDSHLEGGDDPFGGPVFPRFWTKGQSADARRMKLAAGALMVTSKPTAAQGLALLEAGQKEAVGEREKTNILIALTAGNAVLNNFEPLHRNAAELLRQEPTSRMAFVNSVQGLLGLKRYDEAMTLVNERLRLLEDDEDALRMKMTVESFRGDFRAARATIRSMIDKGKENAELLNSTAWYALFMPTVEEGDISDAIKSVQMSKENPHIMHTLACLYAATGKTKEAHDLLVRSMDDLNLDEPNDDYWYAFGLIAEQYGEREVAIADYRKLKLPTDPLEIPTSTYVLAQARLKAMGAEKK